MAVRRTVNQPEVARHRAFATSAAISAIMDELSKAGEHSSDHVQLLWREWRVLHNEAVVNCHRAQGLEAQLFRTVGAPVVRIHRGPDAEDVMAHSHDDIDQILAETNTPVSTAQDLHRKLATRQREWNDESERIGFAAAVQQEKQAWSRERQAASMIFQTPAHTLTGAQMKLALMMQKSVDAAGDSTFAFSQLQSIFSDLARLNEACRAR